MENNYSPGSESIKPDRKHALKMLQKAKAIKRPTKFVYQLDNRVVVFSNKSLDVIEKIYNQKAILLQGYKE